MRALVAVAVAASVAVIPAAGSQAQGTPTFTASWSATTVPETGSATVTVTTTDPSIADGTDILVTLQVGRNESTAGTSDIEVLDYNDDAVSPQLITATSHHRGGWLYIKSGGSKLSYGQAKTKAFTVRAVDDADTAAEDLAVWVYVNGELAGSQTLSLTTDPAFTFGALSYTATEGGTAATVQVRLPSAPSAEVSIPLEVTRNGGATSADHSTVPSDAHVRHLGHFQDLHRDRHRRHRRRRRRIHHHQLRQPAHRLRRRRHNHRQTRRQRTPSAHRARRQHEPDPEQFPIPRD